MQRTTPSRSSRPATAPAPALPATTQSDFSGAVDDRLALSDALARLQRRERTILHLRFVEGLTQTQIADRVGLSQMYVSRLLRATLENLRHEIESGGTEPDEA